MSQQLTDLDAALGDAKTVLDAAVVRDQAILAALTALQNNPPAPEDLSAEIQKVKDLAAESGTIAPPPAPAQP